MNAFMSAFSAAGLTDFASYIRPCPEKYEGENINYRAVLNQDPKKNAMHLHALGHGVQVLESAVRTAYIDVRNSNEDTPFHVAAHVGRPLEIAEFFATNGADINARNNQGNTPLHLYITTKLLPNESLRPTIITMLLNYGANPDIANRAGLTPLALALMNKTPQLGALALINTDPLMRSPASFITRRPEFRDREQNTYLHLAVQHYNLMLPPLLQVSTEVKWLEAKNAAGETALAIARRKGDMSSEEHLRRAGARM